MACLLSECCVGCSVWVFFFQAEDGIRDLVRSRGLGDVYKRQEVLLLDVCGRLLDEDRVRRADPSLARPLLRGRDLSLIHI